MVFCWECDSSFLLDGLAKAAAQGSIEMLIIPDKAIVESKIAQLKKVWKITKITWIKCSGCEQFMENVMARQGWNKMFTVIKHIQTKNMNIIKCARLCQKNKN